MRLSTPALYACLAWLALVLFVRSGPPFVRFPAFAFPDTGGVMALPIFLADGAPAEVTDYTDFAGIGAEDVDVVHDGIPSVVAHRFYELQRWIAEHPAPHESPERRGRSLVAEEAPPTKSGVSRGYPGSAEGFSATSGETHGTGGAVEVTVGLRILRVGTDGALHEEARIDARGTARRR